MVNTYCIHPGDCLASLRTMADQSVQCCITSPPYWGLRDYGHDGQIGLEETPEAYVAQMVEVFREVRRVLKDDGTLWLNLGDSYSGAANSGGANQNLGGPAVRTSGLPVKAGHNIKPKDLVGIPWRVAFALQADGWWLRQDIIWHKPNPMPESVTDRCTKAHEYVFLLTKSQRYYYDAEAVSEASVDAASYRPRSPRNPDKREGDKFFATKVGSHANGKVYATRNRRSVWTVTTKPYSGAHFAVMPEALVEPCLLAGSRPCDLVLDPFTGSGTVGAVAVNHGRSFVGCELNPDYIALARQRIGNVAPLFTQGVTCAER
jgi:DNA modification methylase